MIDDGRVWEMASGSFTELLHPLGAIVVFGN